MDRLLKVLCWTGMILLLVLIFINQNPIIVTDKYEQAISQYNMVDNESNMAVHHYYFINTSNGEMMVDKYTYDNIRIGEEVTL